MVLDAYSRAVAGYSVSLDAPSALQTALALRQAIWRKSDPAWPVCGIPGALYSDHGSDFTSRHLDQVCVDLHNFRLVHRLFARIRRVLEINELRTFTREVVETARETLVIGA